LVDDRVKNLAGFYNITDEGQTSSLTTRKIYEGANKCQQRHDFRITHSCRYLDNRLPVGMVMRLPEIAYRSVPGIIIILGVAALYLASETYNLIHASLYINMVIIAGLVLVVDGILMVSIRMSDANYRNELYEENNQELLLPEEFITNMD
jgi:hypothetical protein